MSGGDEDEMAAPTEDGPPTAMRTFTPGAQRRNTIFEGRNASLSHVDSAGSATARRRSVSPRVRPAPGQEKAVMGSVPSSQWVPDDMATNCCVCRAEFNLYKRRHHCRTCGRVVCDGCSANRINSDRTCALCWDRLGRKMSGLGLGKEENIAAAAAAAAAGRVRKSALAELIEEERFNRNFVVADGRNVSYSTAGVPDGLPVFLFLGLDAHRHSAAHFEDPARRHGLRLICIDRPGRGRSDPIPSPAAGAEGESGVQTLMSEAIEAAVVDTVKQMCVSLRIEKAAIFGQSLGSVFALRCARDEGLKDTLDGTTVCLVSPWVPLAVAGCNTILQKAASNSALTTTVGKLGGDMLVKLVSEMARGSSGANEVEKGYLQAPYTQDLIKHVTTLKEGRESIKNEVWMALHNKGEEEAIERCSSVLHPVHIWHGRSDQMVPNAAFKWLKKSLPSCTATTKIGGTHALIYDKGEMEDVFANLKKGVSDAKSKARFTARRLGNQLSYVASSVFASGNAASSSLAGAEGASAAVVAAGSVSPRSGEKNGKAEASPAQQQAEGGDGATTADKDKSDGLYFSGLQERLVGMISTAPALDSSAHSTASSVNVSRHDSRPAAAGASESASRPRGTPALWRDNNSNHGFGSGHGSSHGSGHGGNGQVITWQGLLGTGGNGSGHGAGVRRLASAGNSGSRHGLTSSRHGSDAPASIPENGQLVEREAAPSAARADGDDVAGRGGILDEVGRTMTRALSGAFGSEHSRAASASRESMPPPQSSSRRRSDSATSVASTLQSAGGGHVRRGSGDNSSQHSEGGSAAGFLRQLDRVVSSLSLGAGESAHGSGWGGSTGGGTSVHGFARSTSGSAHGSAHGSARGSAHGSAHGSVGGGSVGGGSIHGGSVGSRRPSGLLLPWSAHDVVDGTGGSVDGDGNMVTGLKRVLSSVGVGTPRSSVAATPRGATDVSGHNLSDSGHFSWSGRVEPPGTPSGAAVMTAAGYDAAMTNWPAGKVEGNPAWEEWSPEKKLTCHLVTASCLALIIALW